MTLIPKGYHTWEQIEGDPRRLTLEDGARAPIADPLFMLAQQWRAGEFRHEEGALPISAEIQMHQAPLTAIRGPDAPMEAFEETPRADEALAEPPVPQPDAAPARAAMRLGRSAEAALGKESGWKEIAERFQAQEGKDRAARMRLRAGHACVDGARLLAAIVARDAELSRAPLWSRLVSWAASEGMRVRARSRSFLDPRRQVFINPRFTAPDLRLSRRGRPPGRFEIPSRRLPEVILVPEPSPRLEASTFDPRALAHRGTVSFGDSEAVLEAGQGRYLDWTACSTGRRGEASAPQMARAVPTRLSFPGKPPERFWTLSEAATDWDGASVGPADLGRMLAGRVLARGSADWFILPLRALRNARVEVAEVTLRSGFSDKPVRARAGSQEPARLWASFGATAADTLITLGEAEPVTGPVLERVLLKPEEASNLIWMVERILQDADGRGRMRTDVRDAPASGMEAGRPAPLYHLQVSPPENWYPLLQQIGMGFSRTSLAVGPAAGKLPEGMLGRAITDLAYGRVPANGLLVERQVEMGRAPDGTLRIWVRRSARIATAETASSGIAFDVLALPSEG